MEIERYLEDKKPKKGDLVLKMGGNLNFELLTVFKRFFSKSGISQSYLAKYGRDGKFHKNFLVSEATVLIPSFQFSGGQLPNINLNKDFRSLNDYLSYYAELTSKEDLLEKQEMSKKEYDFCKSNFFVSYPSIAQLDIGEDWYVGKKEIITALKSKDTMEMYIPLIEKMNSAE